MILDSSFLIDFLRNNPRAIEKYKELAEKHETVATTAINIFEIWRAMYRYSPEKRRQVLEFLTSLDVKELTMKSALHGGKIDSELSKKGQPIEKEDCMIAAIALENQETLVTHNVKHVSRVLGLTIETY